MKNSILLGGLLVSLSITAFGATNLISNGGFELGGTNWTFEAQGPGGASVMFNNPHTGFAYLALGGVNNSNAAQDVFQTVTLPAGALAATLTYSYFVYSIDTGTTQDAALITDVRDAQGQNAQLLDVKDNTKRDPQPGTYHQASFDLTSYAGRTIQLDFEFEVVQPAQPTTYFGIDDVSLTVLGPADLPPNDAFVGRIALTTNHLSVLGTNTLATKEPGEPAHALNAGGKSLWWTWTAAAPGTVTLTTAGSSFDTLLAVYTGNSVSNLTKVAANNNGDNTFTSRVTFPSAPGTQYQIAVDGANGASGVVELNLDFTPDAKPPVVAITTPAAGARVTNSTVNLQGTASDNIAVAEVDYRLENASGTNDYQIAVGTNHWTATVTNLVPGLNTVRVRALDSSSNVSAQVTRSFTYVVVSPLALSWSGAGAVSPNLNGQLLELNKSYTLTARPGAGSVFSNWTGGIEASTPVLKFAMQSNLVLQANFITNPFTPVKGNYAGLLLDTNGIAPTNSGFFTAAPTDRGTFTAKIQLAAGAFSLSGQLSLTGAYSNSIPRRGHSPLSVQLQVDLAGADTLSGWISSDSWTAALTAYRDVYSRTSPPAQGAGKYTLVFPRGEDASTQPGGYGFGALSLDTMGNVAFSGTLGDGTKVTQRTFISKDGQWPFFNSLYSGGGAALGWLTFTNEPDSDLRGTVNWSKPPQPSAKLYRDGFTFTNGLEAVGSRFFFTNGVPVLDLPGGGVIILQDGNLAASVTNGFSLAANNKVTGTNKIALTLTTSSGLFQGSVLNPANGKPVPVSGALLQKQNDGFGLFLGTNQTGSAFLRP